MQEKTSWPKRAPAHSACFACHHSAGLHTIADGFNDNGEINEPADCREDHRSGRVRAAAHRHQCGHGKNGGHDRRMDSLSQRHSRKALCGSGSRVFPFGDRGRQETAGDEGSSSGRNRPDRGRHSHAGHAFSGDGLPDPGPLWARRRLGASIYPRHARALPTR